MKRLLTSGFFLSGLLVTSLSPLFAQAQMKLPPYQAFCKYEPACGKAAKMKKGQLVPTRPKPELMIYYRSLRPLIIQVAHQYKIDPVTLVLAPLAENTMNVGISDKLQDEMEAQGLLDDDGAVTSTTLKMIYDKPMSIGPGQIYVFAAKNVEPLAALIENRPVRPKKEIKKALKTPEGALRYAAAIIRDAQEVYARGGVDISHRPEILTTLYNIGKVKQRLANAQGRDSYPNYFGYFSGLNYDYVKTELGLPSN